MERSSLCLGAEIACYAEGGKDGWVTTAKDGSPHQTNDRRDAALLNYRTLAYALMERLQRLLARPESKVTQATTLISDDGRK